MVTPNNSGKHLLCFLCANTAPSLLHRNNSANIHINSIKWVN